MGILLVYDVSEEDSFANVTNWMSQIDENAGEGVKRVLVANKCDVPPDERVISEDQGRNLAEQYGIPYFETSAKSNFNVEESFMQVTRDVLKDMVKEKGEGEKEGLKLGAGGGSAGGSCC
ncbi:hypothetical protein TrRE_jg7754 [Triparma retinervis]|uniref:Uncharacterized protein n=1 Tax=Triparma retinervis TaxID=2557542 RepID=A0A9W6ZQZ5_9STRA|nr:hypothetical protein TrRE_jg7754 [Triparma retinervis]